MLEILSAEAKSGLQNVYTPLSLKAHLLFCVIATVLYLVQFYRRGSWHYLCIMAAIDLTFVTQTSLGTSSGSIAVLGVLEAVLLIAAMVFYASFSKQQKAQAAAEEAEVDEARERQRVAEKIQEALDKKLIDNAFEDDEQ